MSAPLLSGASTTTVPNESPEIMRLRTGKRGGVGEVPNGTSLMTAPCLIICSFNSSCWRG